MSAAIPAGLSEEQSRMAYAIRDSLIVKYQDWKPAHRLDRWFALSRLHYPAFIGTYVITCQAISQRWIFRAQAVELGGGVWVSETDLGRQYLTLKYPNRRVRCTTRQYKQMVLVRKSAPIYTAPCQLPDAVYIDIRAAYWSIVKTVGWDVDYNPGRWLERKSSMADFPYFDNKLIRSSIVSAGLTGTIRFWTGTRLTWLKKSNGLVNLVLWALVQDVLHGMAADAVEAGAVYVYADGYIVPSDRITSVMTALDEWGIPTRVVASGAADVVRPACYRVGEKQTLPYRVHKGGGVHRDLIDWTVNRRWLRSRIRMMWADADVPEK